MFVGDNENRGNVVRPNGKKREVENPKWRHVNLTYVYLSFHTRAMKFQRQYSSFGVQPSNGISVNVVRPNREKPEVADITGSTFFDLPLTPTSESVLTSSAVLADLENVGVDFGISLLSLRRS